MHGGRCSHLRYRGRLTQRLRPRGASLTGRGALMTLGNSMVAPSRPARSDAVPARHGLAAERVEPIEQLGGTPNRRTESLDPAPQLAVRGDYPKLFGTFRARDKLDDAVVGSIRTALRCVEHAHARVLVLRRVIARGARRRRR